MILALGIDMGGTATRWVARDEAGRVTRGTAPGASAHLFNPETRAGFLGVLRGIAAELPAAPSAVHAGLTGHDDAAGIEARAALAAIFGAGATITVSDDVALAWRAVFGAGRGHLVVAGTGSIGYSAAADGTATRVGGRGMLIDDGGSGSWIALCALDALLRAFDRDGDFRAARILHERIAAAVGGPGWPDIRAFVYGSDRGRIGVLARAVAEAAAEGDPLACAVLDRAVEELARIARVLIARCGPAPVAFIGGVLRLDPRIAAGLRAALPGTDLLFPEVDAALAAATLAFESLAR